MFWTLPNAHPFLVHFPIALFSFGLALDLSLLLRFRLAWIDRAAVLVLGVAALSSIASAVSGKISADALAPSLDPEVLEAIGSHGDLAFFTVVLLFIVFFLRLEASWRDREHTPRRSRVRLAACALALVAQWSLLTTSMRGGELVYRYGVGVDARALEERR